MTQKGQQNHFNVKFLKGYGFGINVKDNSTLILKNCYDPFSEPKTEEWNIRNLPYEKIVISGKGYISTEALSLLSNNNRNVILLDNYGKPVTFLNPVTESLTASRYRMGQYDTFRDESKRQYLARQIVKAKLDSQIKFLELTESPEVKDGIELIRAIKKEILSSANPIKYEAKVSRNYFKQFVKLIPEKYGFISRNSSQIRIAKNQAPDVINALLNYGYTVLAGEVSKFINGLGLDAYYGFYHKSHTGFQPLVYDMIEPFRWLVDYSVFKIVNHKDSRYRIKLKEYKKHSKTGNVLIEYDLIRRFLELLERNFQKERRYEFRHGAKTKDGLKSVQEITVAKIMVQNLAEYCTGKQKEF